MRYITESLNKKIRCKLVLHRIFISYYLFYSEESFVSAYRVMSPRANNSKAASKASGRSVVNDSPVDCQSREVTEDKFFAENLPRPCGSNPLVLVFVLVKTQKRSYRFYFCMSVFICETMSFKYSVIHFIKE